MHKPEVPHARATSNFSSFFERISVWEEESRGLADEAGRMYEMIVITSLPQGLPHMTTNNLGLEYDEMEFSNGTWL